VSLLTGVFISLRTSDKEGSGTNDNIYLGVEGTGGGREFLLDVSSPSDFDDFEKGSEVYYNLGGVSFAQIQTLVGEFEIPSTAGFLVPDETFQGGINDPAQLPINFQRIDRVYLRKMGDRVHREDDALILGSIAVWIYSDEGERRKFYYNREFRLGSEFGLQVWLRPVEIEL
jgi:hypothetical protein